MNEYEINQKTMALISNENGTQVFEEDNYFTISKKANKIMEESCEYFGSSLSGRQKGTENLIGVSYKAPVIVEESQEIIFFPTTSPRNDSCSWISHDKVEKYYEEDQKLILIFKNGQKAVLDLSYGVFDNQILRSTRLESVLRSRKNGKIASK